MLGDEGRKAIGIGSNNEKKRLEECDRHYRPFSRV